MTFRTFLLITLFLVQLAYANYSNDSNIDIHDRNNTLETSFEKNVVILESLHNNTNNMYMSKNSDIGTEISFLALLLLLYIFLDNDNRNRD